MRAGAVLVRGGVRPGGGSRSSEHLLWTCPRQTRRQAQPCGWFAHLRLKGVAKWLQDDGRVVQRSEDLPFLAPGEDEYFSVRIDGDADIVGQSLIPGAMKTAGKRRDGTWSEGDTCDHHGAWRIPAVSVLKRVWGDGLTGRKDRRSMVVAGDRPSVSTTSSFPPAQAALRRSTCRPYRACSRQGQPASAQPAMRVCGMAG